MVKRVRTRTGIGPPIPDRLPHLPFDGKIYDLRLISIMTSFVSGDNLGYDDTNVTYTEKLALTVLHKVVTLTRTMGTTVFLGRIASATRMNMGHKMYFDEKKLLEDLIVQRIVVSNNHETRPREIARDTLRQLNSMYDLKQVDVIDMMRILSTLD